MPDDPQTARTYWERVIYIYIGATGWHEVQRRTHHFWLGADDA